VAKMAEALTKEKLKERELMRVFEPIEDEIGLIKANAKFNYVISKTPEKETGIILAFAADTEKHVHVLKERVRLLLDVTR
jgi:hypothetical protein